MKKIILSILSNMALCIAVISLSQCSAAGAHQPEVTGLKKQIQVMKRGACVKI